MIDRIILVRFLPVVLAVGLFACVTEGEPPPPEEPPPRILIHVVGADSAPFRPDTVSWHYAGGGLDQGAACVNSDCTDWGIDDTLTGVIYVEAFWNSNEGASCSTLGYQAQRINLDSLPADTLPYHEVTLAMWFAVACE